MAGVIDVTGMKKKVEIEADVDASRIICSHPYISFKNIWVTKPPSPRQVVTSFLVDAIESIKYLKGCIGEKFGILSANLVLSYQGELLEDEALFGFYGIPAGGTINLSLKNNDQNAFYFPKLNTDEELVICVVGDIHTGIHMVHSMERGEWKYDRRRSTLRDPPPIYLWAKPTVPVYYLKCLIEEKANIAPDHQQLTLAGQILEDSQLLISYGIERSLRYHRVLNLNLTLNAGAMNSSGYHLSVLKDRPDGEQESCPYREFRESAARYVPIDRAREMVSHVFRKGKVSKPRDWAKWKASQEDLDRDVLEVPVFSDGEEEH